MSGLIVYEIVTASIITISVNTEGLFVPRPGLDDLCRNRDEIDLISTDVFDTLLLRRGKSQRTYLCRGSPVWPLPERTGTVHRVGFAATVMVLWVVILRDELAGRALNQCAGFPEAWQTVHGAAGQLDRCRRLAFSLEAHYSAVYDEHAAMYEKLRARDEEGVAEIFQVQLDSTFPSIDILLRERPDVVAGSKADFDIARIR
jgi:hypothetical protein